MERPVVADDVIVKTGLPGENGVDVAGANGDGPFVLVDDGAQCARIPMIGRDAQIGRLYGYIPQIGRICGVINNDYPMHMVGHHHKCTQFYKREMIGYGYVIK